MSDPSPTQDLPQWFTADEPIEPSTARAEIKQSIAALVLALTRAGKDKHVTKEQLRNAFQKVDRPIPTKTKTFDHEKDDIWFVYLGFGKGARSYLRHQHRTLRYKHLRNLPRALKALGLAVANPTLHEARNDYWLRLLDHAKNGASRIRIAGVDKPTEKLTSSIFFAEPLAHKQELAVAATSPDSRAPNTTLDDNGGDYIVTSPLVGTFRHGDKHTKRFADVGSSVKVGDMLFSIEALTEQTPILAPCDGRIKRLLASNNQAVEFGQELAIIEPSSPLPTELRSLKETALEQIVEITAEIDGAAFLEWFHGWPRVQTGDTISAGHTLLVIESYLESHDHLIRMPIHAPVSGMVSSILFMEGQRVSRGQLLMLLKY